MTDAGELVGAGCGQCHRGAVGFGWHGTSRESGAWHGGADTGIGGLGVRSRRHGSPEQLLARVDRAQSSLRVVHAHLGQAPDIAKSVLRIGRQAGGGEEASVAGDARTPTSGSTGLPADPSPSATGQPVNDIAALPPPLRDNLGRYRKKLPAAAEQPRIDLLPGGVVRFESRVPGRVPGSYALYTKTVAADGATLSYTKTTVVPDGSIAHVKDKMNP